MGFDGLIAAELDITPRAALCLVEEISLREMTGRGRFRAWGDMIMSNFLAEEAYIVLRASSAK
nr:helix-turn-helix domain-containing protein [Ochrobactrum sp. AN78]